MSITKRMYIGNALANRRRLLAFTSTFLQLFIELSLTKARVCMCALPQYFESKFESSGFAKSTRLCGSVIPAGTMKILDFRIKVSFDRDRSM